MCFHLKINYVAIFPGVLREIIKKKDNFFTELRIKVCFSAPNLELSWYFQLSTRRVLNAYVFIRAVHKDLM